MDVAYELMPEPDWAMTTTIAIAHAPALDATEWAELIFDRKSVPLWGQAMFGARIVAAKLLRLPPAESQMLAVSSVRDGVAIIDTPDKHLRFVATVRTDGSLLHVTTAVRFTGAVGRLYFVPVRVVHDPLTRSMMQRAARRASARRALVAVAS